MVAILAFFVESGKRVANTTDNSVLFVFGRVIENKSHINFSEFSVPIHRYLLKQPYHKYVNVLWILSLLIYIMCYLFQIKSKHVKRRNDSHINSTTVKMVVIECQSHQSLGKVIKTKNARLEVELYTGNRNSAQKPLKTSTGQPISLDIVSTDTVDIFDKLTVSRRIPSRFTHHF